MTDRPISDMFAPPPLPEPDPAQLAAAYRDRALDLAVRWTERHLTPEKPEEVVRCAKVFAAYLRGDDTSSAGDH